MHPCFLFFPWHSVKTEAGKGSTGNVLTKCDPKDHTSALNALPRWVQRVPYRLLFIYLLCLRSTKLKKSLHLFGLSLQRHITEQSRQKEHCLDYYYAVRKSIETAFKM